jgi:DNA-binding LytR/AlgR family response regulator
MQIEIKVDETCEEPKIIIITNKVTDELTDLVKSFTGIVPQMLIGFRNDNAEILREEAIYRIYTASGKVYAVTDNGEYTLRLRLYELEQRLDKHNFVRISNSEIIHLQKVKSFDLSFSGTICISLSNGMVSYVSRRYVPKIKQVLGI